MTLNDKYRKLRRILGRMDSVLVAFSGGVDSTFLARVAQDVLPGRVLAVTMVSVLLPESEKKAAAYWARQIRVPHRFVRHSLSLTLRKNSTDRCYYCKKRIFSGLLQLARKQGLAVVVDGSNKDDRVDYRPGTRALQELRIRSPLQEAGLGKEDIRRLSRGMGLAIWDKPAMACLASRLPYGERLTDPALRRIERAEDFLRSLGLVKLRVRQHGAVCRIEVPMKDMARLLELRRVMVRRLQALGYAYVTMDMEGYRTGSMNEVLAWKKKR